MTGQRPADRPASAWLGLPPPSSPTSAPAGHGSAPAGTERRLGHLRPELLVRSQRPGVIPLMRLQISEALDGSLRTMRGAPQATMGVALLVGAAFLLPTMAAVAAIDETNVVGRADEATLTFLAPLVAGSMATFALLGLLAVVSHEAALGRSLNLASWWAAVRPRLGPLLGTMALVALIVTLAGAALTVPLLALGYAVKGPGGATLVVLCWLLGVPWTWWWSLRLAFSTAVTAVEHRGPWASIRRSWALTRRFEDATRLWWWTVAACAFAAFTLFLAVAALLLAQELFTSTFLLDVALPGYVVEIIDRLTGPAITLLSVTLGAPYLAGVLAFGYLDRRFAYEGYDVQMVRRFQDEAALVSRR